MKGIVLLSGGLDSATALRWAMDECEEVLALSFLYGSTHQSKESQAAKDVARAYDLPHQFISLPEVIYEGSDSALLGGSEIPDEEYHDPEKESPSVTVVPFRNAVFISIAVALAGARSCDRVYAAVHSTDARGFAYPDCTPEFIGAMSAAVYVGSHSGVRLVTPFQWMTKADIVRFGLVRSVPYHLTWSCYRGEGLSCGRCPTCKERLAAFAECGEKDPIEYEPR